MNRGGLFFGDGDQNAAFGRTVKFGNDKAGNVDHFLKGLYLRQGILSGCGVNGQQSGVRRFGQDFSDDADDFFSSSIRPVLFCSLPAVSIKTISSFCLTASVRPS